METSLSADSIFNNPKQGLQKEDSVTCKGANYKNLRQISIKFEVGKMIIKKLFGGINC